MKIYKILIFSILSLILFNSSYSQEKHFKANASPSKLTVKAGEIFAIKLVVNMDKGYHIYELKTKNYPDTMITPTFTEISLVPKNLLKISGKINATKPKSKYDSSFFMMVGTYYGKVQFNIPVKAIKDIDFSKMKINIIFSAQQCTETACLPPEDFKIPIDNKVADISPELMKELEKQAMIYEAEPSQDNSETDSSSAAITNDKPVKSDDKNHPTQKTESQNISDVKKKEGIFSFIWFAMLQGALALLTPCVFPMIPITVSFFTKRSEKKKGNGLTDSLVYSLGIISTFTAIGIIVTAIFGPAGIQDLATNPWLNLAIAAVFILFSFNLFGAFEIQLPTGILNKLNARSQGTGMLSVLFMGLTFSLTSFTCTVPFVGTALISMSGGEWFYPIIGMLGFSVVFAAPFFLLALFPSAMQKMPRAGGWMNNIKVVMGFLEIAAAIKFISNADLVWSWGIMPRELFLAIWIGCAILIFLYILGFYRFQHDAPVEGIGALRAMFGVFFVSIIFYLMIGLWGKPLGELDAFLPPPNYQEIMGNQPVQTASMSGSTANPGSMGSNYKEELVWLSDYKSALETSKRENKTLFIDFTGYTCTNCRWMELNMFSKPEVRKLMEKMVLVRLFTDRKVEPSLSNKSFQQARFKSIELPLYVLYNPQEELLGTKAFTRDINEFVGFLKKGLE